MSTLRYEEIEKLICICFLTFYKVFVTANYSLLFNHFNNLYNWFANLMLFDCKLILATSDDSLTT